MVGSILGRAGAAGLAAGGLAAALAGSAASAAPGHVILIGQASLGVVRGATLSPIAGPRRELVLLRRRSDYLNTAEMIAEETRIISKEVEALRAYNDSATQELAMTREEVEALKLKRETAAKAEADALRQRLEKRRVAADDRLGAAENELATTEHLREQAVDEGAEVSEWRKREEALRQERDRLRRMLEQVSQLEAGLG